MRTNSIKKSKPLQENPEAHSLQKEMEDLIFREKTKRRIVSKLLHQTIPPKEQFES